jgi:hypothetical protein
MPCPAMPSRHLGLIATGSTDCVIAVRECGCLGTDLGSDKWDPLRLKNDYPLVMSK